MKNDHGQDMQKYCAHRSQTDRLVTSFPHGTEPWPTAFCAAPSSNAISCAPTFGCVRGSSRNQRLKHTAHTTPIAPNNTNAQRHETNPSTHATSSGVNAPPQRALNHTMPCARTRSAAGSQMLNALVMFGKQPASPMPKKKRQTTSDAMFHAQPVAAVKADHITTTRISTLRGPSTSPSQPPGISNSAYAQPNAPNT